MKYEAVLIIRKSELKVFQKEAMEILSNRKIKIEIMEDEIFDRHYRSD